ncbi:MAG: hypothetical protein ABT940_10880 [Alphaproteobacteria bacterium]
MSEQGVKIVVGERWIECFSELPVVVDKVYTSEVHITWERDGLKSVLPRDFFEDLWFPAALLER